MNMYIDERLPMARTYSIAEARNQLPALVHDAEEGGAVSLTRRGTPVAVLISVSEYERLRSGRTDFVGALDAFRVRHDLADLRLHEGLEDTRDASTGREFSWE